jgi:hypothetical protein
MAFWCCFVVLRMRNFFYFLLVVIASDFASSFIQEIYSLRGRDFGLFAGSEGWEMVIWLSWWLVMPTVA